MTILGVDFFGFFSYFWGRVFWVLVMRGFGLGFGERGSDLCVEEQVRALKDGIFKLEASNWP